MLVAFLDDYYCGFLKQFQYPLKISKGFLEGSEQRLGYLNNLKYVLKGSQKRKLFFNIIRKLMKTTVKKKTWFKMVPELYPNFWFFGPGFLKNPPYRFSRSEFNLGLWFGLLGQISGYSPPSPNKKILSRNRGANTYYQRIFTKLELNQNLQGSSGRWAFLEVYSHFFLNVKIFL